jgi:hypothetical protein
MLRHLYLLESFHGTKLFFDTENLRLRHGHGASPRNVCIQIVGNRGRFLVFGSSLSIVCQIQFLKDGLVLQAGLQPMNRAYPVNSYTH